MEIENQALIDYFTALGFELIPIEDGLTALSAEETPDGEYALITNDEGGLPDSLEVSLILACYTGEGAYSWSTSFKNAAQFAEIWSQGETYAEKLQAAQRHREEILDPRLRVQL